MCLLMFLHRSIYFFRRIQLIDGVIVGRSDPVAYGADGKGEGELAWNWAIKVDVLWVLNDTHTHMDN